MVSNSVDSNLEIEQNDHQAWNRALFVGLAAFLVSRLCVVAGTGVRAAQLVVDAREDLEPEPDRKSVV